MSYNEIRLSKSVEESMDVPQYVKDFRCMSRLHRAYQPWRVSRKLGIVRLVKSILINPWLLKIRDVDCVVVSGQAVASISNLRTNTSK